VLTAGSISREPILVWPVVFAAHLPRPAAMLPALAQAVHTDPRFFIWQDVPLRAIHLWTRDAHIASRMRDFPAMRDMMQSHSPAEWKLPATITRESIPPGIVESLKYNVYKMTRKPVPSAAADAAPPPITIYFDGTTLAPVTFAPSSRSDSQLTAAVATILQSKSMHATAERYTCVYCEVMRAVLLRCSRCHLARYCNERCQREHWKTHKPNCHAQ
jgi:hypothetical protein